ncbi:GDSL esterase/lipase At1g28590 [Lactuca sativa]|uniref:GDSL esterase/lipase At1g28590 n=1 Tax=Lactuca sativa TaxID=4236 RepID=UPI0022B013D0|nr:GDSL esterase/lipase At1g28590 [Lactuca sativa]
MEFSTCSWSITCLILMILQPLLWNRSLYANGCYTFIFSFGDSLADPGNIKQLAAISHADIQSLQFPYGETFFHEPTGRASNGRLIIDFLAESLGLPLIPPFLNDKESDNVVALGPGVNYAVVAATALDTSFHEARGTVDPVANISLGVELAWFKRSLASICSNASDCRNLVGRSLILMGEIGGTDYNNPIFDYKPIEEVESYVPLVIDTIISAVNELIDMGAQTLVVPGTFPIGCSSSILTVRASRNKKDYDNRTGCLIRYNELVEYHNDLLIKKLNHLRELHPNVIIIYADYYNAAMQIIYSPIKFGFTNPVLKSCCGGGGPYNYNFNLSAQCGHVLATVCDDPDAYAYWDGIHFTEAAYRIIFKSLFQGHLKPYKALTSHW